MRKLIIAALLVSSPAAAAFEVLPAKDVAFSFQGPFGKFDRAQLQRGFQVYKEVCSSCHALQYVTYRELAEPDGPGFSVDEVKALAAENKITDGPDTKGEMFERARRPSDGLPAPYASKEAAVAILGAAPPDLSLIAKARAGRHGTFNQLINGIGGSEYIYSVLTGYGDAPEELKDKMPAGKYFNPYFRNGPWISMAPPLTDGRVTYADGTPATVDQMSRDVAAFLTWTAEPRMVDRKRMGLQVIGFLSVFTVLVYAVYRRLWRGVH